MIRYIDADALIVRLENSPIFLNFGEDGLFIREFVIRCIQDRTTADAVEVVRCKDCKHHPENGGECDRSITHTGRDYVCEMNTYRYINLEFCSYGERRAAE